MSGPPDGGPPLTGPDLVRQALAAARAAAAAKQPVVRRKKPVRPAGERGGDPMAFGAAVQKWVTDQGAEADVAIGRVTGAWETLVSEPLASRCRPVSLVDGELVLEAESTAWATQVRLLAPQVVQTLTKALGPGVVTRVRVHGPTGPSWSRGPRRVQGRGPRDTFG